MNGTPIEGNATGWRDSINVALMVMHNEIKDNTGGALYYYAQNIIYPYWAKEYKTIKVIGNHTFMKP